MSSSPLSGVGVLVTRAAHQAGELSAAIEQAGGSAVSFPVIEIQARSREIVRQEQDALPGADIVIFASPNAVQYGIDTVATERFRIAAIGPATAAAIEAAGRRVDIVSGTGFDSEHLLAEPELSAVAGKSIRILRGDRGRHLLATTLRARGARVDYVSVYRRLPVRHSPQELAGIERTWRAGGIDYVTVMSVESLDNLLAILPPFCRDALETTPLVTPSNRVIQTAADKLPALRATLAPGPQAADMLRALITCRQTSRGYRNEPEIRRP